MIGPSTKAELSREAPAWCRGSLAMPSLEVRTIQGFWSGQFWFQNAQIGPIVLLDAFSSVKNGEIKRRRRCDLANEHDSPYQWTTDLAYDQRH